MGCPRLPLESTCVAVFKRRPSTDVTYVLKLIKPPSTENRSPGRRPKAWVTYVAVCTFAKFPHPTPLSPAPPLLTKNTPKPSKRQFITILATLGWLDHCWLHLFPTAKTSNSDKIDLNVPTQKPSKFRSRHRNHVRPPHKNQVKFDSYTQIHK